MPVATYNAIVSGRAGLALLVKGDQTLALRAGEAEPTPVPISSNHHLLGESQDLEFQQAAPLERVSEQLSLAVRREQALDCVLTLLSDRYPDELRQLAAEELTPELEQEPVRTALEGVMYAAALPDSADLVRAKDLTVRDFSQVNGWLTRLGELQPIIGAVRRAWSEIEFEANDARQEIEAACVRAGAFREFVAAAEQRQNAATKVVQLLQHPVLRARVAQVDLRRVLRDWQTALSAGGVAAKPSRIEMVRESDDEDAEPIRSKPTIRGFNRHQAGEDARQQVERISALLQSGDLSSARRWTNELVEQQLRVHQGRQFAAKSLCNLAIKAQELSLYEFQLECTGRAIELGPDDGWACCQHAHALLNNGYLAESLAVYEGARLRGQPIVAQNGRAEVLKAMGRHQEALDAYEQVRREHSTDIVAQNGRAEVLRAMGRHPEALDAYEQVCREHPTDVFAQNGRAEVLKAMGRYEEALVAYKQVRREHPTDVVAQNGWAEVLKAMGRHQEALDAYEQVRREHPTNVVAKTGRAEVLKVMGHLHEACQSYRDTISAHPTNAVVRCALAATLVEMNEFAEVEVVLSQLRFEGNDYWVAQHIRGMSALRQSNFEHAANLFQSGARDCPFGTQRGYFVTALASTRLRQRRFVEATEALDSLADATASQPVVALRVQICGEQKQFDDAAIRFKQLATPHSTLERELFAELKERYVVRSGPHHDDDWLFERHLRFQTESMLASAA